MLRNLLLSLTLTVAVTIAPTANLSGSDRSPSAARPCKVRFTGPYPNGATQYYIADNKCYTSHYNCQVIVNGQVHQKCVPPRGGARIYTAKTTARDKVTFKIVRTTRCFGQ